MANDANIFMGDPVIQNLGMIAGAVQEIIQYIQARDVKVIDRMRLDAQNDPTVVRSVPTDAEKLALIDAINFRVDMIKTRAAMLSALDLTSYNAIGRPS